jgi:hypothetical protein
MTTGNEKMGVICDYADCREPFLLARAGIAQSVMALPDPFEATCPHCRRESTYAKSEVHIQMERRSHE